MKKKNFYLKKLEPIGGITVWLVDGNRIRRELDMDFTNFGQHFVFSFIPKYEFWLDREAIVLKEKDFFISHLLVEWEMMGRGYGYAVASEAANQKELADRVRAGDLKKVVDRSGKIINQKLHGKLLKRLANGLKIWLVDGRLVRSAWDPEFTAGSHHRVDSYIPEDEIWIDSAVNFSERLYAVLHELYERNLMMKENLDYDPAHDQANVIEQRCRRQPKKLAEQLALLGWKDPKLEKIQTSIGHQPALVEV